MNRREYLGGALAALGAACGDSRRGLALPFLAEPAAGAQLPGVKVVTDYAAAALERGTAREDWGPAFEAAWNAAAAEGTDVFVPAGEYRVRPRQRGGAWVPALTLSMPEKYRPVRMLGPAVGAKLRVEAWPQGAPPDLEVVRLVSAVRSSSGATDVANGGALANLSVVNAFAGAVPAWSAAHDFAGVGLRVVGLYGGAISGCFFQGFSCAVVLGDEGTRRGVSYMTRLEGCRFQYCNQAVRLPPTANGNTVRDSLALWMNPPAAGPVGIFQTGSSTGTALFDNNHAESCAGWVYDIGATVNARITGGRFEQVFGAVRVSGTGNSPARGTQIGGLSVDCDSLRGPAIWLERAAGTLISGVTFYQSRTPQPHLRVETGAVRTTLMTVDAADVPLRVVDPAGAVRNLG